MDIDQRIAQAINGYVLHSLFLRMLAYVSAVYLAYVLTVVVPIVLWTQQLHFSVGLLFTFVAPALIARFGFVEIWYLFFKRPRPSPQQGITPLFSNINPSFPSGHAAFFSAIATSAMIWGLPGAFVYSGLVVWMCIARVAVGAHYPSDILGGIIVGVGTAWMYSLVLGI